MPILSVDAQPNGFRFVTGGSDHKVCIWNLLPAISLKYENPPSRQDVLSKHGNGGLEIIEEEKKHDNEASASRSGIDEDHKMIAQQLGEHELGGDQDMRSRSEGMGDLDNDEVEESKSEDTLFKEYEAALIVDDEEGFEGEIRLMASLFESDKKRYQKLLAVRDNHTSPVNCVRWNPLGTLFISCSDDGSIILWEYVGEMNMQASGFQKSMYNVGATSQDSGRIGLVGAGNAALEENKAGQQQQEDSNIYEEWRNKRTWKRHEGGVSDCAWSPDSIHFASCGTDSHVIIWSINEASPIKVIEAKANGITFDPFGRFMATQSSEDKSLTIWRIQQDFKIVTQECSHTSYYKQSMGMSLFRRLSWSADGQFISTTAGRVAGMHTAPLIERSTWKLAATLAGHAKSITSSRINSRLFRDPSNEDSQTGLSCYSIVAIASIDSTISVWKPGMDKPLTVIMDIFMMGASDLSWGFNGNILLASSHDGKVFMIHYQPGKLGSPLTELEKQLIIEKKYGASILNDYKTHTKLIKSANIQSAAVTNTNAQTSQQQTKVVNGKKKIMPAMTMAYQSESYKIDPHQNPFHNQMLKDDSAMAFNGRLNNGGVGAGMPKFTQPSSSIEEVIKIQASSQVVPVPTAALQLPPRLPNNEPSSTTQSIQLAPSLLQVVVSDSIQTQPLVSLVDGGASDFKQQQQVMTDQKNQEEEKRPVIIGDDLENSGKKTKKLPKKRKEADGAQVPMGLSAAISQQNVVQLNSNGLGPNQQVLNVSQSQVPGTKTNISQATLQAMQREQYSSLERMLSDGAQSQQQQVTVISLEDYQALISVQGKEEMQLVLPARDIFSEEIRIMISNIDSGNQNEFTRKRCAEIRMYSGSENIEVERSLMDGEFIVMSSMCGAFYILYSSSGKLSIFNSRTISPIRQGMLIDGVCFIDSNEENMTFAVLTLKGILSLYKVKIVAEFASSFQQSMDACALSYQCSIVDILRQRNSQSSLFSANGDTLDTAPKVSVKSMKLLPDTSVLVFLSDNTVFEYDPHMRLWRQTLLKESQMSPSLELSSGSQLKSSSEHYASTIPLIKDLSSVIAHLEQQTLASQPSISDEDLGGPQRSALLDNQARLLELVDSLTLYERLQMKSEFLYTLRMLTLCILQIGDMQRLRDLILEYKFVISWEEEQMMSKGMGNIVSKESAMANVALLMNTGAEDNDQEMLPESEVKKGGRPIIERPSSMICGGLDKSQVFQEAVLPVLKTVCLSLNCDIKDYISRLLSIMFAPSIHSQPQVHQQHQQQIHFDTNPVANHINDSQQLYSNHQLQSQGGYFHQNQHHLYQGEHGYMLQAQQIAPSIPPQMQLPSIQNVLSAARIHNVVLNNNPYQ